MNSILSVATIGQQVSGVGFPVSGTVQLFPSIEYSDDGGATFAAASGTATAFGSSSIVFAHPGLGVVSGATVTVKDTFSGAVGVSNEFAVIAALHPQILPNAPSGTVAGVAFPFTGDLVDFTTTPSLTYKLDGGTPTTLTGVTVSGWSENLTVSVSGAHTIVVSGAGVSGSVSFTTAAATVVVPPTTWNAADKSSTISLSSDGLTATTSTSVAQSVRATTAIPASGLIAFEVDITAVATDWATGVANASFNLAAHGGLGSDANGIGLYVNSPTQAAFYADALDGQQGSSASSTGEHVSVIVHGESLWWSNETMRTASGVKFNNSTTADPATNVGGVPFSGLGTPRYPVFNCLEGGAEATINGGAVAFSSFLTSYMAAHSGIATLDGVSGAPAVKQIVPTAPVGTVVGTAFDFTGELINFPSTPALTYKLDGGTPVSLTGVTSTAWSESLTMTASGTHTIVVSGAGVSGSVSFTTTSQPVMQIVPTAPTGVVAGTAFTDQGTLINFPSTPSLVYELDGGSPTTLGGVTRTNWSTSLTVATSGTHSLVVSGAGVSGSVSFTAAASGAAINRVVAPLPGTVVAGSWVVNRRFSLPGSPSGLDEMQFNYRLPAQYDPDIVYPIFLVGHPNNDGMGSGVYPKEGSDFVTSASYGGSYSLDTMFNRDLTFQRDFPCVLVACQIDQTGNSGGLNANGVPGYNDSPNSSWNEQAVNGIIQAFIAGTIEPGLQVDPGRRYVGGYSLGGYLTLAEMFDNNQWDTPSGGLALFTAGITYSDGLFRPGVSNLSLADRMITVPLTVIGTTSDNDETAVDEPFYTHYSGGSTDWPTQSDYDTGGMAAIQAGTSAFHYINFGSGQPAQEFMPTNANGGDGTALYQWLFSQVHGGTASGTGGGGGGVSGTASPDGSFIVAPTTSTLTDSAGNAWGITSGGKVSMNGVTDINTGNVVELAWVGGVLWQENSSALWWGKSSPTADWVPEEGTATNPLASGSGGGSPPPSGSQAVPIAVYVGNPGDAADGDYPGFDAQWDGFVSKMGRSPTYNLTFMDQTFLPDDSSFGWPAQGSYFSGIMKADTRTVDAIPVIGMPFGSTAGNFFSALASGTYDTQIQGCLAAWKANGYSNLVIRQAWEMNIGVNYPVTAANAASFVAAFKHVYTVVHTYASGNGMTVKVVWNPNVGPNQNDATCTVADMYPGDAFVDIFGIDTYGSPVDGTHDNVAATSTDPKEYLVTTMVALASGAGKTICFAETGGTDTTFATSMVGYLTSGGARPNIEFFTFWDIDDSSGALSWSNADGQTTLAGIWVSGFGVSGTVTNTASGTGGGGSPPPSGDRQWYQVLGGDRTLATTPPQTTALWIESGPVIDQLHSLTTANVRSFDTTGFVSPFWVSESESDILCTFHDGSGGSPQIPDFQMRVPAGAYSENGSTGAGDNAAGFIDKSRRYKYVTINDCRIGSNSSNASAGGVVSATNNYIECGPGGGNPGGMIVQDATGPIWMDAVNGSINSTIWENGDNVTGCVTYYDLQQCNADPDYVIEHMVAVNLGRNVFSSTGQLLWPLVIGDTPGGGSIPEGAIIGIPASTARPTGMSRGKAALFDLFQQRCGMFNNVTDAGQIAIKTMPRDTATAALVADMSSSFASIVPFLRIMNYTPGTAGAQYSLATMKGRLATATEWSDAFPAPPTLDFSGTDGAPVKPDTFGAWQAANGLGQVYDDIWNFD